MKRALFILLLFSSLIIPAKSFAFFHENNYFVNISREKMIPFPEELWEGARSIIGFKGDVKRPIIVVDLFSQDKPQGRNLEGCFDPNEWAIQISPFAVDIFYDIAILHEMTHALLDAQGHPSLKTHHCFMKSIRWTSKAVVWLDLWGKTIDNATEGLLISWENLACPKP